MENSETEQPGRSSSNRRVGRQGSMDSFANEDQDQMNTTADMTSDDSTPPSPSRTNNHKEEDDFDDDDLMLLEQGRQHKPRPEVSRSDSSPDLTVMDDSTSVHSLQSVDSTTKRQKRYLQMKVAVEEEKRVSMAKRIMLVVLFLAAVAVSVATYVVLRNEQEDEYQQQVRQCGQYWRILLL